MSRICRYIRNKLYALAVSAQYALAGLCVPLDDERYF